MTPMLFRTRMLSPNGALLERTDWLTPYNAETVAEDAMRVGSGGRLEVRVPKGVTQAGLDLLKGHFSKLGKRGIAVNVKRDESLDLSSPQRSWLRDRS
jgi:hypothetical protein